MSIIKHLVSQDQPSAETKALIEKTFRADRLIARDDGSRFDVQGANNGRPGPTAGGDSTLQMHNVFKSLKALAGHNDSIFVILDDREDVWVNERHELPLNLLRVPPYFYHEMPHITNRFSFVQKIVIKICQQYDLDISLMCHLDFLYKIVEDFYSDFEAKKGNKQQTDIKFHISSRSLNLLVGAPIMSLEYFVRWLEPEPDSDEESSEMSDQEDDDGDIPFLDEIHEME